MLIALDYNFAFNDVYEEIDVIEDMFEHLDEIIFSLDDSKLEEEASNFAHSKYLIWENIRHQLYALKDSLENEIDRLDTLVNGDSNEN